MLKYRGGSTWTMIDSFILRESIHNGETQALTFSWGLTVPSHQNERSFWVIWNLKVLKMRPSDHFSGWSFYWIKLSNRILTERSFWTIILENSEISSKWAKTIDFRWFLWIFQMLMPLKNNEICELFVDRFTISNRHKW